MADVDDELLALVGGDESSEDEGSEQEMNISGSASGSPEPAKSKKSAPAKKPAKKRKQDYSDEEEGEASSPASQDSAPMDESDSDAEGPRGKATSGAVFDDEDNKYPVDGKFASLRERNEIMAMGELEREQILADREEEIERIRQNRLLRQLVTQTPDVDGGSAKKRKAGTADLEETQRKTSRQRTKLGGSKVGETSAGIESLRRARAEKNDRARRREEDRERNKDRPIITRESPEHDDDGDSELEWGASKHKASKSRTPEVRDVPVADIRDFERVRLGRTRFAQVCFYPGFEAAITGCTVRVAIGPDQETGAPLYRMAIIKGFTKGKPYAIEKKPGSTFVTDQYLLAAHGKATKDWPFIATSNSPFTEEEFRRLQRTCEADGVPFPKKPTLSAKIDDINALHNRSWTEEELHDKITRERDLRAKYTPVEKERILAQIDEARRIGDKAQVAKLQDHLEILEEAPRLAFKTSLTPTKKSGSAASQQDRLAQINAENRRRNQEAVRKAQLKEKAKARELEARAARGEDVQEDMSRRLKTKPKFMQDINDSGTERKTPVSGASTPANGTPKLGATSGKSALPAHVLKLQQQTYEASMAKKGIPQIHRPVDDDAYIAAMDLDIDVDID